MAVPPKFLGIPTHALLGLLTVATTATLIAVFHIPSFFGLPLYGYLGIVLLFLVIFQVSVAKHWLKIEFIWHRRNGMLIFYLGLVHATIALGAYLFHVKVLGF